MSILSKITKFFGGVRVLDKINLHLEKGLVYTLMGENGFSKATLSNTISGFLKPWMGVDVGLTM